MGHGTERPTKGQQLRLMPTFWRPGIIRKVGICFEVEGKANVQGIISDIE